MMTPDPNCPMCQFNPATGSFFPCLRHDQGAFTLSAAVSDSDEVEQIHDRHLEDGKPGKKIGHLQLQSYQMYADRGTLLRTVDTLRAELAEANTKISTLKERVANLKTQRSIERLEQREQERDDD